MLVLVLVLVPVPITGIGASVDDNVDNDDGDDDGADYNGSDDALAVGSFWLNITTRVIFLQSCTTPFITSLYYLFLRLRKNFFSFFFASVFCLLHFIVF